MIRPPKEELRKSLLRRNTNVLRLYEEVDPRLLIESPVGAEVECMEVSKGVQLHLRHHSSAQVPRLRVHQQMGRPYLESVVDPVERVMSGGVRVARLFPVLTRDQSVP